MNINMNQGISDIAKSLNQFSLPELKLQAEQKQSNSYNEFVRRIHWLERAEIEDKMKLLENYASFFIDNLLKSQNSPNGWGSSNDRFANDPDMPFYALIAFRRNLMNDHQLGTLLQFWSAKQHHIEYYKGQEKKFEPKVCPLFDHKDRVIESNLQLLSRTFSISNYAGVSIPQDSTTTFSNEECQRWLEEIKKLPKSEQQFFVVPYFEKRQTISDITFRAGFPIFDRIPNPSETLLVVPSFGMMQTFLNVKYGQNAVRMRPVLGISAEDDIKANGLNGERDVACHFPGVYLTNIADNYYTPWNLFTHHDFFHCSKASSVPDTSPDRARTRIIKTANIIAKSMRECRPSEKPYLEMVRSTLIDMEFDYYKKEQFVDDAYWLVLSMCFKRTEMQFASNKASSLSEKARSLVIKKILKMICLENPDSKLLNGPKTNFKSLRQKIVQFKKEEHEKFASSLAQFAMPRHEVFNTLNFNVQVRDFLYAQNDPLFDRVVKVWKVNQS